MSNLIGRSPEESIRLVRQIYSYEKAASILKFASIDKSMVRNDSISENLYSQLSIFELSGYLLNNFASHDSDSVSMNFGLELRPVLLDESIVQLGFHCQIILSIMMAFLSGFCLIHSKKGFQ